MQREIKFRGKRVDTGQWVYGYYAERFNNYHVIYASEIYNGDCFIVAYPVMPETVGQYTGLKDENGIEIYEGDIVTGLFGHTDIIGHIIYGSDATFFIERKGLYGIGLNNAEDWLEVIGDIYDNPEFLKEVDIT
jgi:uncharacterized phage protein (TIGR01671 family)